MKIEYVKARAPGGVGRAFAEGGYDGDGYSLDLRDSDTLMPVHLVWNAADACWVEECATCDGTGWVEDPTACGDPEHCSPVVGCPNPNCTAEEE